MTDHELIANLHRRMDQQDKMLLEIRDKINAHVIESDQIRPALEELVTLWKGSKLLVPMLVGATALIWGIISWAKVNLR